MESLELEGTSKGHLVQHPCSKQGHPQLGQVVQGLIQSDLERVQRQSLHYISGRPKMHLQLLTSFMQRLSLKEDSVKYCRVCCYTAAPFTEAILVQLYPLL